MNDDKQTHLKRIREGTEDIFTEEDLEERLNDSLREEEPLRVKLGIDPTATDLHLGHTVVFRKLRDFQELGHTVVLIIGDFTARIGDPSDKDSTRPKLSAEEVRENAKDYLEQVNKILDVDRAEVHYNSDWLESMSLANILDLASELTVARFLEHDRFRKRFESNRSIHLHEFLYPIMQAYDSVAVDADVEIGGTDQTFNLLVARDMMKRREERPEIAITVPLLIGLDGSRKMSKSLGNHIGLRDEPYEMFSRIMSLPDELLDTYYRHLTELEEWEIHELIRSKTHPMELKKDLAEMIVADIHDDPEAARDARERWVTVFSEQEIPGDLDLVNVTELVRKNSPPTLLELVRFCDYTESNNEARRLINQGAVRINDEKRDNPGEEIQISEGDILRVGKKRRMVELTLNGTSS